MEFIEFILLIPCMVWRGYVLSILWKWFMVPLFHLPALNIPFAMGLALIVFLLTQRSSYIVTPIEERIKNLIYSFVYPGVALLAGWIITFWM